MPGLLKNSQGPFKILSEETKPRFLTEDFLKPFFWFYLGAQAERKKKKVGGAELSVSLR